MEVWFWIIVVGAVLATAIFSGCLFLILAAVFYRKRKIKLFLVFGFLSNLFLSLPIAAILDDVFDINNRTAFLFLWAILFIVGMAVLFGFYRKVK